MASTTRTHINPLQVFSNDGSLVSNEMGSISNKNTFILRPINQEKSRVKESDTNNNDNENQTDN